MCVWIWGKEAESHGVFFCYLSTLDLAIIIFRNKLALCLWETATRIEKSQSSSVTLTGEREWLMQSKTLCHVHSGVTLLNAS